jgi:hypothetical protein
MKFIKIICGYCKKEKELNINLYNNKIKYGNKNFYCSQQCYSKSRNRKCELKCENCDKLFYRNFSIVGVHNYCSRNCAAKINNRKFKKRKKIKFYFCINCKIDIKQGRKYCKKCLPIKDWSRITINDMHKLRKYQINSKIREMARNLYKKYYKTRFCYNCGYNKHVEICHIKPISSFNSNDTISKINDINNLISLCPNCHWELDNGLLKI